MQFPPQLILHWLQTILSSEAPSDAWASGVPCENSDAPVAADAVARPASAPDVATNARRDMGVAANPRAVVAVVAAGADADAPADTLVLFFWLLSPGKGITLLLFAVGFISPFMLEGERRAPIHIRDAFTARCRRVTTTIARALGPAAEARGGSGGGRKRKLAARAGA